MMETAKNDPANSDNDAILIRIRRIMLVLRGLIILTIAMMVTLSIVLLTQNERFSNAQLQMIRGSIVICGLVGLAVVAFGARWTRALESRARELAQKVTDVKKTADDRLSTAMAFSAVPQVMTDDSGTILNANPSFAHLIARDPIEIIGATLEHLLRPLDEETLQEVTNYDYQEESFRQYRGVTRASDMSDRIVRMVDIPVPVSDDDQFASLVQFEDLTDWMKHHRILADDNRLLEQRVEARTKALQNANAELESFAYSVSHDLRGPLRAIDGFGQVLKHSVATKLEPQEMDYLERITGATNRMGELIDALLKMSRLTTAKLDIQRVDLTAVVKEVAGEVAMQFPDHRVDVQIQDGMQIRGDRVLIQNLFTNLIANGFKFTRNAVHPRIAVTSKARNKFWTEIEVRDNGAGFDQKYVKKLFRPFQRLHRSDEFEGHGIGLASVKRIIDRHGGMLEAEGEVGKGATLRVTLPSVPRD